MKKTNKVVFTITQHIPASITGKGKLAEDLDLFHTFETETQAEINTNNLGLWLQANMIKYVKLQKIQGLETFRQNKPVSVTIKVNNRLESMKMKFSLNIERIVKNLERYPVALGQLFTPVVINGITAKKVLAIANGDLTVIAKSVKEQDKEAKANVVIELPVPELEERLSLDNVDLTDADLAQMK